VTISIHHHDFIDLLFAVVFMNDARSGAVILLGLFIQSPFVGLCALIATLSGTWTGFAMSFPAQKLNDGFYGYNACLVGAAIATFSPLMRWTEFAWMANSIIPDSSFAGPVKPLAVPQPGLLLFTTFITVIIFGAISTLVQQALINTFKV
jgi:urea transporter